MFLRKLIRSISRHFAKYLLGINPVPRDSDLLFDKEHFIKRVLAANKISYTTITSTKIIIVLDKDYENFHRVKDQIESGKFDFQAGYPLTMTKDHIHFICIVLDSSSAYILAVSYPYDPTDLPTLLWFQKMDDKEQVARLLS